MQNMSNGKSALGLDGNIAALLGYIIGIVAIISLIIEKDNKFVRFHALQAILWWAFCFVGIIAVMIVGGVLAFALGQASSALGGLVAIIAGLLYLVLLLAMIGGLIYGAIKAYGNDMFKLPIVGNLAESWTK